MLQLPGKPRNRPQFAIRVFFDFNTEAHLLKHIAATK
jgi:hypothetical protein